MRRTRSRARSQSETRPDLALTATFSERAGAATPSTGSISNQYGPLPTVPNWDVGLVLRWQLFDAVVAARGRAAATRAEVARADLSVLLQQQTASLQQAYLTLEVALAALSSLERAVDASRANYAQAEARFKAGLGTSLELADAESVRTDAEIQLAVGTFEAHRSRAVLGRLIGEDMIVEDDADERLASAGRRSPSPHGDGGNGCRGRLGHLPGIARRLSREQDRARRPTKGRHGRGSARVSLPPVTAVRRDHPAVDRGANRTAARLGLRGHRPRAPRRRRQAGADHRDAGLSERVRLVEGRLDAGARDPGASRRRSPTSRPASRSSRKAGSPRRTRSRSTPPRAPASKRSCMETQAKMQRATLEVSDCVLRAPFAGEIAARSVDPGAFVHPGTAVATLVDRTTVRVIGEVPEGDFEVVAVGTPVQVRALATNRDLRAKIARRSPAADLSTRTVHLEIDIPDPESVAASGNDRRARHRGWGACARDRDPAHRGLGARQQGHCLRRPGPDGEEGRLRREGRTRRQPVRRPAATRGRARRHGRAGAAPGRRPGRSEARSRRLPRTPPLELAGGKP